MDGKSRKVSIKYVGEVKNDIRQAWGMRPYVIFLRYTNEKAAGGNPHDSFSFSYEGGDSFELFNYLKYMITENCDVSVSILEKENKKS